MRLWQVKKRIGEKRVKEFLKFMHGQTVGVYSNRAYNYYKQDVENFLRPKSKRFFD